MHIFRYSPRKGTVASKMPNQIEGKVKEERSNLLIELSNENEKGYLEQYIGKEIEVLLEEIEGEYIKGHTTNYMVVKLKLDPNIQQHLENTLQKIQIVGVENLELIGKLNF